MLNTGEAGGARCAPRAPPQARLRRLCFGMRQCGACFLCRQAWQTPPGSFALHAGPEYGHQRLSARCKTPLVRLPSPAGPAAHRMPRPLTFPKSAAAGAGAEYGACGISGPCNFPKARCLTPARPAAALLRHTPMRRLLFMRAGVADASRQLCPARWAGAWASTAFRALQNALGSVAPSGGACGAPYAPPPDLPEERGGWRWRGVWRLRHIRPLQFSKGAVLNTGEACGARCAPRVPLQKARRWNKIKKMCRAAARPMLGKEASKRC